MSNESVINERATTEQGDRLIPLIADDVAWSVQDYVVEMLSAAHINTRGLVDSYGERQTNRVMDRTRRAFAVNLRALIGAEIERLDRAAEETS